MTIIGWGVDDSVSNSMFSSKDGTSAVEYWIVRNSWGPEWGIDGILHLPMYPFNKVYQVEVSSQKGSIVMFQSTCIPYKFRQEECSRGFIPPPQSNYFCNLTWCQLFFILFFEDFYFTFTFCANLYCGAT